MLRRLGFEFRRANVMHADENVMPDTEPLSLWSCTEPPFEWRRWLWRPWWVKTWWLAVSTFWSIVLFAPVRVPHPEDCWISMLVLHPFVIMPYVMLRTTWVWITDGYIPWFPTWGEHIKSDCPRLDCENEDCGPCRAIDSYCEPIKFGGIGANLSDPTDPLSPLNLSYRMRHDIVDRMRHVVDST